MTTKDLNERRAWIVLLTRPSYLPGVIILHHTLQKVASKYPLVVAVTPSLPEGAVNALLETGLQVKKIDPISPPVKVSVVAERFEDTWTKLAVWGFVEYDKAIMLDGDMMLLRNMDELFDLDLPESWIAANHACVCNLDRDAWADDDWREENCAYTPLVHPTALTNPTPIDTTSIRTHTLLNSGLVIFRPSNKTLSSFIDFINTSTLVVKFTFPDQDFLAHYYKGRWKPIGWQYNAIKTARYWHPKMWRDEEVRNLHYIVDKPWNTGRKRGGDDEVTHGWWWDAWKEWEEEMREAGKENVVEVVRRNMRADEA